jgi:hypothetical protein
VGDKKTHRIFHVGTSDKIDRRRGMGLHLFSLKSHGTKFLTYCAHLGETWII